jgi:uncharacterized membrane protein
VSKNSAAGPALRRRGGGIREVVNRAFAEFLGAPILILVGFVLVAVLTLWLDTGPARWVVPLRTFLHTYVFGEATATSDLLGAVAGSLITVTAFTFSLLLLAVQLPAGSLTQQILDQFIRRRFNQVFFGFFLGLALYALIVLITVEPNFNPVISAALVLLLTGVALFLLVLLLYGTLNQMRPAVIVDAIHVYGLRAWEKRCALLAATRRTAQCDGPVRLPVCAERNGYVTRIDVTALARVAAALDEDVEIDLAVIMGSYVAFDDTLAVVNAATPAAAQHLAAAVPGAIRLEQQRDLGYDPAFVVQQLENIAWTNITSSKQNPAPALLVIHNLRDLLARWSAAACDPAPAAPPAPVVYQDDVIARLLSVFSSLAVAASEGMQHQSLAAIAHSLALMLPRLDPRYQAMIADLTRRMLAGLGDQILTRELHDGLTALERALAAAGCHAAAADLRTAQAQLHQSIGVLNSRSTRVPPP